MHSEGPTLERRGRVVVLGGGGVGSELAQFFNRLGSQVTIVQDIDHLLPRDDPDAGALLRELLEEEGVEVRVSTLGSRWTRGCAPRRTCGPSAT